MRGYSALKSLDEEKYKKLNEDYAELKNKYDELSNKNAELIASLDRVIKHCNQIDSKLTMVCDVNKVNADVIQFLATRKFGDDPTIEFAAVKTYRGGWVTLYLNGEEFNPNGKDVTIWADRDEPVRIEVSNS